MFTNKKDSSYKELHEFLQTNNKCHYLQTNEWAQVKTNWQHEMITIKKDKKIVGTMSILLKKIPILNSYMMYAPRGFVCNPDDEDTLKKMTQSIKEIANKYNAFIFRMDPDIPDYNTEFKEIMKSLNYKFKTNSKTIQPKFVYRLEIKDRTNEELLKSFKSKTRYNINLAMRKNVKIKTAKRSDIPIFYSILKYTAKRDHFHIRDIAYYEKIFDTMSPEHIRVLIAEYKNEPIATAMSVFYGDTVWYLYGGSMDKYRNYMPTYLVQYEMIKWAVDRKCKYYDFGGVSGYKSENDPMYGVFRFKKGFNGEVVEYVDELYLVFRPHINTMYNIMSDGRSVFLKTENHLLK